jgi:hypothetical protein
MNWEVTGRERPWRNKGTIPEFTWGEMKTMKTSVRIASVPTEIQTKHLLNKIPQRYRYIS